MGSSGMPGNRSRPLCKPSSPDHAPIPHLQGTVVINLILGIVINSLDKVGGCSRRGPGPALAGLPPRGSPCFPTLGPLPAQQIMEQQDYKMLLQRARVIDEIESTMPRWGVRQVARATPPGLRASALRGYKCEPHVEACHGMRAATLG